MRNYSPGLHKLLLLGILSASGSGCAGMLLSGGSVTSTDYGKEALSSYRVNKCIDLTNDLGTETPSGTMHLVRHEGETVLFERSIDGTGTLFKNRWRDRDGDHFFAWIGLSSVGFEYIIPLAGKPGAKRLVYVGLQSAKEADGTVRPISKPGVACDLVRIPTARVVMTAD